MWQSQFVEGEDAYETKYGSGDDNRLVNYPERTTLSGEFVSNGAMEYNA